MDEGEAKQIDGDSTTLREFSRAVGGHSTIFKFDETTICKILTPREFYFYKNFDGPIRTFIPKFKGIVNVDTEDRQEIKFYARRITENDLSPLHLDFLTEYFLPKFVHDDYKGREDYNVLHNKSAYLLLENISSKYAFPCILDLKMGTRSHGDTASSLKAKKQTEKCSSTTSQQLGVRMCGVQIYNEAEGTFHRHDKYYCRKLNVKGFKDHLHQFFCCCTNKLRIDICVSFLEKLKELKTVIENYHGYRFFSCSLLLIYEGQSHGSTNTSSADMRLIDFAHTSCNEIFRDLYPREGPDDGFLKGLQTVCDLLYEFIDSVPKG